MWNGANQARRHAVIDGTVFLLAPSAAGFGFVVWAMRRERLAAEASRAVAVREHAVAPRPLPAPAPAVGSNPVPSV